MNTGTNLVAARFATPDAAIIRYRDNKDSQTCFYTSLVPSDANLLFPWFDQPDLKAHFRWTITAPTGWTIIANGPLNGRQLATAGTGWRFAETEPIYTYLAAFAAGPSTHWTSMPMGEPISL